MKILWKIEAKIAITIAPKTLVNQRKSQLSNDKNMVIGLDAAGGCATFNRSINIVARLTAIAIDITESPNRCNETSPVAEEIM